MDGEVIMSELLYRIPELPLVAIAARNEIVEKLLEIIDLHEKNAEIYREEIALLHDKIAELQHRSKKPFIKPSSLENPSQIKQPRSSQSKPPKADRLPIHQHITLKPKSIPEGSIFKGCRCHFVQDIELKSHNTLFRLERWQGPDGNYYKAELPKEYQGFHFGPTLRAFILEHYYQARVTQPRLLQQLHDWGVDISEGELNHLLCAKTCALEKEVSNLLEAAIEKSDYIQTDDTGARHKGHNCTCTQIGNTVFTYFHTGSSKSRLHFLELLNRRGGYLINGVAVDYLRNLSSLKVIQIAKDFLNYQGNRQDFNNLLARYNLGSKQRQLLMEASILGFLSSHLKKDLIVLSDGASQYKILNHAGCWIHAVRLLDKELPLQNKKAREIVSRIRNLYHHLKRYKEHPSEIFKKRLNDYFDLICDLRSGSVNFDSSLERFLHNKGELLRVLENPGIPLHNNLSENDIREYVVRRKISGGTRSELGRRSRDTYLSLLKTCQKLKISFWDFLIDRIFDKRHIPCLANIILSKT